ncbi:MAG: hypothetical protein AB7J40_01250 [Candidatus Altimarinota bacterium]
MTGDFDPKNKEAFPNVWLMLKHIRKQNPCANGHISSGAEIRELSQLFRFWKNTWNSGYKKGYGIHCQCGKRIGAVWLCGCMVIFPPIPSLGTMAIPCGQHTE